MAMTHPHDKPARPGAGRFARPSRGVERGATLFVVVLVITLLTGIGLYTVHSSALSARAAGNGRQALQTAYVAELGTLAVMSELSSNPFPYLREAARGDLDCEMNEPLDPALQVSCYQRTSASLAPASGVNLFEADSFGPYGTAAGAFRVELTDLAQSLEPVPGMDANTSGFRYYQVALTTIGQLRPAGVGADAACVEDVMQVAGQHMIRAHARVGPVGGF